MKKRALPIIILALILALPACLSFAPHYYKLAYQAEMNRDYDSAIKYYQQAIQENPGEHSYKLALTRVSIQASLVHIQAAQNLASQGKKAEAVKEYETALSYDQTNSTVLEELRRLTEVEPPKEEPKRERLENPVKLKVSPERIELKFTEASLRSIFQALGKHAQVNIIFDELFKDMPITIDITGREFEEAVGYLCLVSKNFFRVIDEKSLIIVPDQPVKRIQYEQNAIKVFYLSNIAAQDIFAALQQMLRTQYRAPNIIVDKNLNTVTVRDTPTNIELAADLIRKWDKSKGEVVIDLEIMEVARQRLREIGVDLSSAQVGLRYAGPGASADKGWYKMSEIKLGTASSYEITLPSALIKFLETDADTRVLAQPRLRGVGDEEIKSLVGQKIPIPQTTFTPIAAGGVNQQPVTSFAYQDVGLDIKIKPKIHAEREVTLEIELKITSIAGSGYADIPIISTREIKNVMRLKDGETNLLAGLLQDEERKSLNGVAGLKNIPVLGNLFAATDKEIQQYDLVLTITPYIIRAVQRSAEDEKPLWIELEGISGGRRAEPGVEREEFDREMADVNEELRRREREETQESPPGDNQISLDPANFEVPQGREFRLSVNVRTQQEVGNLSLNISFNSQVARLKDAIEGGMVRQLGDKVPFLKNIANGSCTLGFSSPQLTRGFRGGGNLAILVFEAAAAGETMVSIAGVSANSPNGQAISFVGGSSRVVVR